MYRDERLGNLAFGPATCRIANGLAVGASDSCSISLPSAVKQNTFEEPLFVTATVGPNRLTRQVNATTCWANGGYGGVEFLSVGGVGSFRVTTANATCHWTVSASAPWITLHTTSGVGPQTVTYSVGQNAGARRSANVQVNTSYPLEVWQSQPSQQSFAELRAVWHRPALLHLTYEAPSTLANGNPVGSMTILLSSGVNGANACMVQYDPASGSLRLMSDSGAAWLAAVALGADEKRWNKQCTLHALSSRARHNLSTPAGPKHVVEIAIEPTGLDGIIDLYAMATGAVGSSSTGWTKHGALQFAADGGIDLRDVKPRVTETDYVVLESELSTKWPEQQYLTYLLLLPTPNVVQFTAKGSCLIEYNRISHGIRLVNDAGTDWHGPVSGVPIAPNAPQLSNSTCTVDVASAVHDADGAGKSSLRIPVRMKAALGRSVTTFVQAFDVLGKFTDMRQFGMVKNTTATADGPGPHASASIVSANGIRITAQAKFRHDSGLSQIAVAHIRIADKIVGSYTCHIVYFPPTNTINLIEGTTFVGSDKTPGTTGVLSNSRCGFDVSQVVVAKGADLTLTIPISLDIVGGELRLYVNAFDMGGLLTHWVDGGVAYANWQ